MRLFCTHVALNLSLYCIALHAQIVAQRAAPRIQLLPFQLLPHSADLARKPTDPRLLLIYTVMSGAAKPEEYGPRAGFLALQPAVERGVAVVLGTSPDGLYLAYGNGSSVIVRSLVDPNLSFTYGEHSAAVKCVKFAPTGKYVASGDASGKVRVWAFNHVDHPLKYELPSIGGEVEDLAWDSESKRILVVGGGAAKAKVRRSEGLPNFF